MYQWFLRRRASRSERKIVIDADAGLMQPPASGQNRGVDGFMNAAAIPVVRPVGKEPDHVIRGGAVQNPTSDCAAPGNIPRFRPARRAFDHGRAGRVQRLIRVEHQDPPAAGARDGVIAGGREIDDREIERDHLRPVAGRDVRRRIRRTGVDDDESRRPDPAPNRDTAGGCALRSSRSCRG